MEGLGRAADGIVVRHRASLTIRRLISRQKAADGMPSIAKGARAALLVGCLVVAAAMAGGT